MSDEIVKDEEVVNIEPAKGDDDVILPEATEENEGEEVEDDTDTSKPDELVKKSTPTDDESDAAPVEGETPREKALRKQIEDLRAERRKERTDEIIKEAPESKRADLSDEDKAVIGKYKPTEVAALKEVLPVLAREMGYVRQDQLASATYVEKSNDILNAFIDKHPEYLPQNDKDGTLWNAFKEEYALYKQPANPKDFSKIFDRIHRDVFGIKPAGALPKLNAQREKAQVASHAGTSSSTSSRAGTAKASASQYRIDGLKGFTDEEKAEMFGE